MAHPTIDLTLQPSIDCPNPAYNCVKYCFESNDFLETAGTKAKFTIETPAIINGYGPGIPMVISGQDYTSGTIARYNEVDTAPILTQAQFAQKFKEAFQANFYMFNTFSFEVSGTQIVATAREVGVIENFDFDFTSVLFGGNNPTYTSQQGTPDVYLDNYRLIVEIWQEIILPSLDVVENKITAEAYTPGSDGEFCINVGEKIAPLLETIFRFGFPLLGVFPDHTISGKFFIRYGESYSDSISSCDVELKSFDISNSISVINSAFERRDQVAKTTLMCEHQWMTSAPQYTEVCETSEFALWINLNGIIFPSPTSIIVSAKYIITYTDGTTSTDLVPFSYAPTNSDQIFSVSAGAAMIGFLADPLKTVSSYEVRIQQQDGAIIQDFASQFFKRVSCCDGDVEFYFLNEYGGYDTILFTQVDEIELSNSNAVFEQFTDCEADNTLLTGKKIVDQTADDIYTVTSKFTDNYNTRKWIREFLSSPIKAVKMKIEGEEILSKVIVPPGSTLYFNKDINSLFLRVQFTLNESLNKQKN